MSQPELLIRTRLSPMKEDDDSNYLDMLDEDTLVPASIRDNEYLQHSSIYGHQFMTGGNIKLNMCFIIHI